MDVQMRAHRAIPGVEHPDHADLPAHPVRVAGERLDGVGRGLKQQVVEELLVGAGDGMQRMRQGAGHEDIGDGQEFLQLRIAPAVSAVGFTFRTRAVVAGVIAVVGGLTLGALRAFPTHDRRATVGDIPHGLAVTGEHPVPVSLAVGWAVGPEDVREFHHP
jgi:hypothetical protein